MGRIQAGPSSIHTEGSTRPLAELASNLAALLQDPDVT
jgi:hypothetical protein